MIKKSGKDICITNPAHKSEGDAFSHPCDGYANRTAYCEVTFYKFYFYIKTRFSDAMISAQLFLCK